ncbi:LSM domain protein [Onchocerca flexuosa]|uniref:Small nuclear ribonucleoprotein G n=1 Tax=Onchocerca flexuosa TaxID=387005 RepID=A0A238BVH4_9BILA|nr:LSM domain protein [Onchocerca flexuosa]
MSKTHPPELKKYMDKQVDLKLNGNRIVSGILRGFDPFMNIVVEDAVENLKKMVEIDGSIDIRITAQATDECQWIIGKMIRWIIGKMIRWINGEKNEIGMVVIRGNSIVIMEPKERLDQR